MILAHMACPVIAMSNPTGQPSVVVGAALESQVGPAVAIGAAITNAAGGMALVAHMSPDDAIALASKLMLAASEVLEATGTRQ